MSSEITGKAAIEALAERFPQLYVAPSEDAEEAYRLASGRGIAPEDKSLAHFIGDPEDSLRVVDTPAGPVEVIFFKQRADFENFMRIIGHRAQPVEIARTVGANTFLGIADWGAVARERAAYLAAGGDDWPSEFKRLGGQPGMFRAEIVVISEGPYSNLPAGQAGYSEEEWLHVSREIRLHHECAHVVCRRLMPDDKPPIWDEITADVVGLLCATGRYDANLAALFLGVNADGFAGGRLSEYLSEEQLSSIDEIAAEVYAALVQIEALSDGAANRPFDFLLELKRKPIINY